MDWIQRELYLANTRPVIVHARCMLVDIIRREWRWVLINYPELIIGNPIPARIEQIKTWPTLRFTLDPYVREIRYWPSGHHVNLPDGYYPWTVSCSFGHSRAQTLGGIMDFVRTGKQQYDSFYRGDDTI